MKKFMIIAIVFLLAFPVYVSANEGIPKTNIGNITIVPPNEGSLEEGFIQYGDSSKEILEENYIGLFINGSIIKNANLIIENDRTLLPLRLISEYLGAKVDWEPTARMVTITDEDNTIELFIDNENAKINDKEYVIDAAPKILNDVTYVPARFVAEALNAKVDYFDGVDTTNTHIVIRMRHVMISKYLDNAKEFTKEEAILLVKQQLIIAFEKKFGEFIPFDNNEKYGKDAGRTIWSDEDEKAHMRDVITNLKIQSENDRYYVMPVVFDFWFDKYTGDIYVFYNGQGMSISVFDPYSEGALAFVG